MTAAGPGTRSRVAVFLVVLVVVCLSAAAYAVADAHRYRTTFGGDPTVPTVPAGPAGPTGGALAAAHGAVLVFRHTGTDDHVGRVAMVPLDDPSGPRSFAAASCDRLDVGTAGGACLRTERGVVTRYWLDELGPDGDTRRSLPLPGMPSRTRLSPDGSLVATTTFVTGHSYAQVGFSTATEIRETGGTSYGNLERFALVVGGRTVSPADRNLWGVSFVDDRTFYATAAFGGTTHLVRGDLPGRTLTSVRENAECPSVSPDGARVAYKVATDGHWSLAVLDVGTGEQTLLPGADARVDDQVEWLDDDTLLYGLPREHEPGVTDVWALEVDGGAEPRLLVEQAWSPAVVRP